MAQIVKKRSCTWLDDDLKVEELGTETEAEKQMKVILEKQLNTKITLSEQFSQHREFVTPSTYQPLTEYVKGTCTLDKFQKVEESHELRQELQRCGLSELEITDYLTGQKEKGPRDRLLNPSVWEERMKDIQEKIQRHQRSLSEPQSFKAATQLSRHRMELERSLYAGTKNPLSAALITETEGGGDPWGAFSHIKELSSQLLRRNKKSKVGGSLEFDANLHHVVVPLEEEEVLKNRLTLQDIRKMDRFHNYEPGEPNKILYLKNLHCKATVQELRAVFGRFEDDNRSPIDYKLCKGRMKGQAFLHFTDASVASKALQFANGFKMRGKPIIIQFGKKT